jgi:hypothetical protein
MEETPLHDLNAACFLLLLLSDAFKTVILDRFIRALMPSG